ncbi:VasL domain-containing protein [Enterobacter hormaechei]|nr:VasL domain-containing protein [Enterobacter hormaechei]MDS6675790.1 VasL domain-containing protein [Enterobacter hormaechei]MDS6707137.1 VasL domain-containing protein [Enterobacter hormaechei]
MRQDIDIDQLMTETWLTVTMLKKGAVTLNGTALYNKCVKQVESVREALERAGYDDASVEHISYAQCALSELKSAVFAMSQSFSHTVPLEEQLRLLSILPAGQPLSAAQLNQTEQHLQQLIASYALLKHQKE